MECRFANGDLQMGEWSRMGRLHPMKWGSCQSRNDWKFTAETQRRREIKLWILCVLTSLRLCDYFFNGEWIEPDGLRMILGCAGTDSFGAGEFPAITLIARRPFAGDEFDGAEDFAAGEI